MSRLWLIFGAVSASIAILITALALWRMFDFRTRWHGLWVNSQWEQTLEQEGLFADHTIIFFGDSQLALWRMAPSFGRLPIRNRGISGDQAIHALRRFEQDSLAYQPDLILFLMGTNDLARQTPIDEIVAALKSMVDAARTQGASVLIGSILPVAPQQGPIRDPAKIIQLNQQLQALADRDLVEFIDFHAQLVDESGWMNPQYTDDGLHPNESGYAKMTQLLTPRLAQVLTGNNAHDQGALN